MKREKGYPRYFEAFFEWLCKPGLFEELQGDLKEEFIANSKSKGAGRSKWIYRKEVILMIRPSVVKSLNEISVNIASGSMFNNYVKTAFRNIKKSTLFSGINIVGLSLSMAVGLLVISGIAYQLTFDQFHEHKERTYRVITQVDDSYFGLSTYATTSVALAEDFFDSKENIDKLVRINTDFGGAATTDSKTLSLNGMFADEDFFRLFSFRLIEGNPSSALSTPFSIVLTEEVAERFFDGGQAIGKSMDVAGIGLFQVTGVVENPPPNSHLQFSSLASFSTIETLASQDSLYINHNEYDNLNSGYLYLSVKENSSPVDLKTDLEAFSNTISTRFENREYKYSFQKLTSIVPGKSMVNQIGPEMELLVLIIFSVLAGIIILSTCFNYTNLSVARALSRTKEIAIRKTLGGTRSQVFLQFIIEAIIIALLGLVVAVCISIGLKPYIYSLSSDIQSMFSFDITLEVALYFILFAVGVGVLAGFIPALILSKQEALKLLKGSDQVKFLRFLNLRKSLIIFQFTLSLICVIIASIVMKQYEFSMNFDLGFDREQVLNVKLQGADQQLFMDEFSKIPEIKSISMSSGYLGVGARSRYWIKNDDIQDSTVINFLSINENYLSNHGIALIAGKNFSEFDNESIDELIIINEKFVEEFNLGSPGEAIGEVIFSPKNKPFRIIGVTSDFHYDRLRNPIGSFFFTFQSEYFQYANLKMNNSEIVSTMEKVETSWLNVNKIYELEAEFYDDRVEEAYSFYRIAFGIIGFVTTLTIFIACMGLLGIVIYTSQSRTKEVAIRKVLGADEKGLIYLLSRSFIGMMVWATGISVTLTFLLFQFVILPKEAYKATLGFWDFGLGIMIIVGIGLVTITTQTLKVARANPVDSIQRE